MKKHQTAGLLLASVAAFVLVTAPAMALSRMRDNPNYGFCKSGKKVKDVKQCKENGGKK